VKVWEVMFSKGKRDRGKAGFVLTGKKSLREGNKSYLWAVKRWMPIVYQWVLFPGEMVGSTSR